MLGQGISGRFGKFWLLAELGRGGMADVYLVTVVQEPVGFHKLQVIKVLRAGSADSRESLAMFLNEARLAARLNHANVVQTHEVGEYDGHYFIAMEYLEGQPFHRVKLRAEQLGRPLPLRPQLRVLSEMLAGLHYAHELGDFDGTPLNVVHRDVSPHNVFVTYDGQVKVVDFGIAKVTGQSTETKTGVVKGKVAYMAPEQALGQKVDRRADIFSAGVMLWEALTGTRLWRGYTDVTILTLVALGRVPDVRERKGDVDPALEAICRRAMARDPNERFATAAEFQRELDRYLLATGGEVSLRDVGGTVAELFADRRAEMRAAIEEQLGAFNFARARGQAGGTSPGLLPSLRGTGGWAEGGKGAPALDDETLGTTAGLSDRSLTSPPAPGRPPGARRGVAVALALGGAAAALAGVGAWQRAMTAAPPPEATRAQALAPAVTEAPPPPPARAPDEAPADAPMVTVTLRADPPAAKLFLDDAPLPSNPFVGKFRRESAVHRVRAEAPGFGTKHEIITLDGDAALNVRLEAKEAAPPGGGRARAAAPSPWQHGPPAKRGGGKDGQFDASDPWQK
jgi:serine/threonine-protein kinase